MAKTGQENEGITAREKYPEARKPHRTLAKGKSTEERGGWNGIRTRENLSPYITQARYPVANYIRDPACAFTSYESETMGNS